ncbi:hypothetical protein QWY31_10520 [Cytophagales bacterium LB-30]|uniref:DUF1735 domain-containing protein n=1 Tax=Shiella aurantiaca TaxID=3058365 RepID=A0ABT8F6E0_9BACT|nr:hypothetical protein [Shiella aurantiaca]MDN4165938.1 hypothetical protein [Shiella aurantiaca]
MKKINLFITALVLLSTVACKVDDYQDANPEPLLDGPYIYLNVADANNVASLRANNTLIHYTEFGGTMDIAINIPDSPAGVDSVFISLSEEIGSVSSDIDAFRGNTSGTLNIQYTAPAAEDEDATEFQTITVTVMDKQGKISNARSITTRAVACIPSQNLAGTYNTVMSGNTSEAFDGDNGDGTYSGLESTVSIVINTTGASLYAEHAGSVRISDISFGLYTAQGYGVPSARIGWCGADVSSFLAANNAAAAYSAFDGVINADGTLTITWENIYGDSGTATLTLQVEE